MSEPLRREDGLRLDPRVVTQVLRVHSMLLASKSRLLRQYSRRAAAAQGGERDRLLASAERLDAQLERLQEERARWALLAPPTTPDYWIASYASLITLTEQLLSDMQSELPRLSGRARRELLTSDMPELRRQLAAYRSELRAWQKRQLRSALTEGGRGRRLATEHPRLTVLDASNPLRTDQEPGEGKPGEPKANSTGAAEER